MDSVLGMFTILGVVAGALMWVVNTLCTGAT